ncbi:MAG: lipopolysaccharide biosynthesis protein [Clostridia bacterium]|nr:lipopolysaccharide biosynthesis protein [Clostridia bacterium]
MESNLKKRAIASTIWKFSERILAQVVSLFVSIIIARILDPSDYSVVSLVTIFFTIANVFISGGFNTALIQKKDADPEDYSSVIFISVIISLVAYLALFLSAPLIATKYEQPILVGVIRVMGLTLPVNAIKSIWCAYISSSLQFKKFFFATIGGTVLSGVVGVTMAVCGLGVWALVAQQMTNTVVDTLILIITTRIKFAKSISFSRLKSLFQYGWKVFGSSLIGIIYSETTPLVIGLKFAPSDLSFYTKGKSFPGLLSTTVTNTLSAVLFPVIAKCQDDKEKVLLSTRMFVRYGSFITFPALLGFLAVADNFVEVVLAAKWLDAVYYIRLFCIVAMFDIIGIGNCESIKAIGKSGVYLIMEIIKKSLYFLVLIFFITLSPSAETLALSYVVCAFIALTVNSIPNITLIGYKIKYQFLDMFPSMICSLLMMALVLLVGKIEMPLVLSLLVQVLFGGISYVLISMMLNRALFSEVLGMMKGLKKR